MVSRLDRILGGIQLICVNDLLLGKALKLLCVIRKQTDVFYRHASGNECPVFCGKR